ncbi:MAG: hypothetical protein BGO98_20845 [Myxococcales bacterium 68-20]|nr:MAG: hypothetical protein BGO98_20845 [Myxococcales bacterium 68-20]
MNDPLSLDPATIAALRSRHVAFLAERLVDDRARGDFIRSFAGGYDHVMARPIRELLQPQTLVAGGAKLLTNEVVRGLLAPIAQEVNRRVVTSLRTDEAKLGDYVPREARAAIDELIARPDLLPEELVRRVFDAEVVEEIMRDVLYDALLEFNESVNPFFADWGLPALIKRFMPIGSGTVLKSMSAVRAEFDKRLEPEIRKFLLGFSRKAKKKIADFVVSSAGDPKLVALRKSIVAFFYEESLAQITQNVDDDARMNADEAALAIVLELLRKDRPRERLIAELEKLVAEHGDEPLGAWLARIGVTERPDLEGLAELLWPFAKLALESPPARAFWERVTWDFYATLASPTASSTSGTVP